MRKIRKQSSKKRSKRHQSMRLKIDHNLHKRTNLGNKNHSSNNVPGKIECRKRRFILKTAP